MFGQPWNLGPIRISAEIRWAVCHGYIAGKNGRKSWLSGLDVVMFDQRRVSRKWTVYSEPTQLISIKLATVKQRSLTLKSDNDSTKSIIVLASLVSQKQFQVVQVGDGKA